MTRIRSFAKNRLLRWHDDLVRRGHPTLAQAPFAPVRLVRDLRQKTESAQRSFRRIALVAQGNWIPFLRPYWDDAEAKVARNERRGPSVAELESLFPQLTHPGRLAVATGSGRTALRVALRILARMNPGRNEVIIPTYCCFAVLEPILQCGLRPIYADIGPDLNTSRTSVARHIGTRTLAVVVVHLGGRLADDLPAIATLAADTGATLVEDLCQAMGGRDSSGAWGASADLAIYSFGLGKNLMATAGGMLLARESHDAIREEASHLVLPDPEFARQRFSYMRRTYQRDGLGLLAALPERPLPAFLSCYGDERMSQLDAELFNIQFGKLDDILALRKRNAGILLAALAGQDNLGPAAVGGPNVWTKFSVLASSQKASRHVQSALRRAGIETEAMYTPLHLCPEGRAYATESLPVSESLYSRIFNLPVRPSLSVRQMEYIGRIAREAAEDAARKDR